MGEGWRGTRSRHGRGWLGVAFAIALLTGGACSTSDDPSNTADTPGSSRVAPPGSSTSDAPTRDAVFGNDIDGSRCPQSQPMPDPPCGPQPMLWAAINGPWDDFRNGDPYAALCRRRSSDASTTTGSRAGTTTTTQPACTEPNPLYRPTGYAFVVEVSGADVGRRLTISGYDLGTYPRTITKRDSARQGPTTTRRGASPAPAADCDATTPPFNQSLYSTGTGDSRIFASAFQTQNCQTGDDGSDGGQNLAIDVFDAGTNGQAATDVALPGCSLKVTAASFDFDSAKYKNRWAPVCSFTPGQPGLYTVRVRNSSIDGFVDVGDGTNAYALKVGGGTATGLHPLGDISTFINTSANSATLPIARVPSSDAGKTLVIDAYDPGDGSGAVTLHVAAPGTVSRSDSGSAGTTTSTSVSLPPIVRFPGSGVATVPTTTPEVSTTAAQTTTTGLRDDAAPCHFNGNASTTRAPETPDAAPTCAIVTSTVERRSLYNGQWLRVTVAIPSDYRCEDDCWWSIVYTFSGEGFPSDRVVWSAAVQ
jgi:hypothetical protein